MTSRRACCPGRCPSSSGHENSGYVHAVGAGVDTVAGRAGRGGLRSRGAAASAPPADAARTPTASPHSTATTAPSAAASAPTAARPSTCSSPTPGSSCPSPTRSIPIAAAPLTDAGLTPYHAVKLSVAKMVPGSTRRRHRRGRPGPHGHPDHQGDDGSRRRGRRREARRAGARRQVGRRRRPRRQRRGHRRPDQGGHPRRRARWSSTSSAPMPRSPRPPAPASTRAISRSWASRAAASRSTCTPRPTRRPCAPSTGARAASSARCWPWRPRGLITPEYTTYALDQALDAYADMDAGPPHRPRRHHPVAAHAGGADALRAEGVAHRSEWDGEFV